MRIFRQLLVISFSCSGALYAQGSTKLSDVADYKNGVSALTDHLPELAVKRFQNALKTEGLSKNDREKLLLLLAESQILSIRSAGALETLEDEALKDHIDLPFWKGQALAAGGLYREAIIALSALTPKSKLYAENLLTLAQLNLSLGKEAVAKKHLENATMQNLKQASKNKAILLLSELYLDDGDATKATALLKQVQSPSKGIEQVQKLLLARIALSEKNYESAITVLQALIAEMANVSQQIQNLAYVYLADAQYANGDIDAAINGLVKFLDTHRESPMLSTIFDRLQLWMPSDLLPSDPLVLKLKEWAKRGEENNDFDNIDEKDKDLCAFSHYLYALYLAESDSEEVLKQALIELTSLRLRHPTHILAGTSLTDTALLQLKQGKEEDALKTLDQIQNLTIPIAPRAKQQAAFLEAELKVAKEDYAAAAKAFELASKSRSKKLSQAATLNAGIAYLAQADLKGFEQLEQSRKNEFIKTQLQLERALWAASQRRTEARTLLHDFLRKNPEHTRKVEAWLSLADHAVTMDPIDVDLCQAAIEQLRDVELNPEQYAQYSKVRYRLAEARGDSVGASDIANAYLKAYPQSEKVPEFLLLKGQALYKNKEYNKARLALNVLTSSYPEHPLVPYALYYTGMSAKLEGTPQAQKEAITIFEKVTEQDSELAVEAELQKAEILESLNELDDAEAFLRELYAKKLNVSQRLDAGILLTSVLHSQGAENTAKYTEAIDIYNAMLAQPKLSLAWLYQIQYRKALTLMQMDKQNDALDVFYQVVNREGEPKNKKQSEWFWYYKCGFSAIGLLEEKGNPEGAISVAKKLASSKGPRSEEAAKRARDLEMKHMIWQQ